jgi:hypothetical protein
LEQINNFPPALSSTSNTATFKPRSFNLYTAASPLGNQRKQENVNCPIERVKSAFLFKMKQQKAYIQDKRKSLQLHRIETIWMAENTSGTHRRQLPRNHLNKK